MCTLHVYNPHCEKNCLRGFQPGLTQTSQHTCTCVTHNNFIECYGTCITSAIFVFPFFHFILHYNLHFHLYMYFAIVSSEGLMED